MCWQEMISLRLAPHYIPAPRRESKVITKKQMDKKGQEHELHLTIVDTMGFPDTNTAKAEEYYDKVVAACNQPLNAIILVVKPERATHDLLHKYRVLLCEFNNAGPPIFMVANGTENYSGIINEQNKKEKKETDRRNFGKFANKVVKVSKVRATRVFVSTDIEDFQSEVKEELFMALGGTEPIGSSMKTSQQLLDEFEEAKSNDKSTELEAKKMKEEEDKIKRNIHALEANIAALKEEQLSWYRVPLIGFFTGTYHDIQNDTAAKITRASNCLQEEKASLDGIIQQHKQMWESKADMKGRVQETKAAWEELRKALKG